MFLLKYRLGNLVGYGIKFCMQRVPTRHTFEGTCYPKNKKYLKKHDDGVVRSIKSMLSGYTLDVEFNSASNELSRSKFE